MTLETEANISCVAVNQVGQGKPDFIAIQVIGKSYFGGKFLFSRFNITKNPERILYYAHKNCIIYVIGKS